MSNTIQASCEFSYKGETHKPTVTIDLDKLAGHAEEIDFHALLANQTGIDTYSYAYEVMQQAPIRFEHATGLAIECTNNGQFDLAAFRDARDQQQIMEELQAIAAEQLKVNNLDDQPDLKKALLQAYNLGKR